MPGWCASWRTGHQLFPASISITPVAGILPPGFARWSIWFRNCEGYEAALERPLLAPFVSDGREPTFPPLREDLRRLERVRSSWFDPKLPSVILEVNPPFAAVFW